MHREDLLNISSELRKDLFDFFEGGGFVCLRYFSFGITSGGDSAELESGDIFFVEMSKLFRFFSSGADEDQKKAGGERVKGTSVSHFVFSREDISNLSDDVVRGPVAWFVY